MPRCVLVLLVSLMITAADTVVSQDYPNRPVRLITAAAGGGSDFTARVVAQGISGPLGQQAIVENRGSGIVPGEYVSKAASDGYTLLVAGNTIWTFSLLAKVPFDVMRDFAPISLLERTVNVVAVHPSLPVKSVKELIALAKARPGALNYGSAGAGSGSHLAPELFKSMAGVNIVHVAYKGGGPAQTALLSGEVQLTFASAASVAPHVKSGRLRALAVSSAEPSALFPGLPTVAAAGVPGYEAIGMTGIFAPARTPEAIINRLNQEIVRALNREDVKQRFFSIGSEVVAGSPEAFAAAVKADMAKLGKLIKEAGIKAE